MTPSRRLSLLINGRTGKKADICLNGNGMGRLGMGYWVIDLADSWLGVMGEFLCCYEGELYSDLEIST